MQNDLVKSSEMTNSKISRILSKMEARGIVSRARDGMGKRCTWSRGSHLPILGIHLSPTQYLLSLIPECKPWESPKIMIDPKDKSLYSTVFYFHFPITVFGN